MTKHATLEEIRQELARGGIIEAPIDADGWHVAGYCDQTSGIVVINPAPELADSICHECCHRRHPRWGEKRVRAETKRLLSSMTGQEIADLCRAYMAIRRQWKKPVKLLIGRRTA